MTGMLRAEGDRRGVRFEREYNASPEEVWSAITEPDRLERWLATAKVDLRDGGAIELVFEGGQEAGGRILALEPGRVVEYEWRFPGETASVVRFELEATAGGTRLVLDHRLLGGEHAASYSAGWHAHLDSLAAHLEGREERDWWARFEELRASYQRQAASLP